MVGQRFGQRPAKEAFVVDHEHAGDHRPLLDLQDCLGCGGLHGVLIATVFKSRASQASSQSLVAAETAEPGFRIVGCQGKGPRQRPCSTGGHELHNTKPTDPGRPWGKRQYPAPCDAQDMGNVRLAR